VVDELHLAEARVRSLEVTLTYGSPLVIVEPKNIVALLGEGWLCDDVINAYMNRMNANLSEDGRRFDKGPTCAFLYTHFASNLVAKQLEMASNNEKAATGAFKADMTFIPVMEDEHWYFVVYYPAHRSLVVFESTKRRHREMIQRIRDCMAKQHRIDDIEDTVYVRNLQENGRDCGVFLLQHINAVSLGLAVEDVVKQEHMPDW